MGRAGRPSLGLHAQAVLASELGGPACTRNPGQRRSVAVRPGFLFLSDDNVMVASLGSATDGQTPTDADASERRQNRLAGSVVCGRKQVCKLACEIVYSCRPKIARDLCRLSSTAIAVEYISFMSG